MDGQLQARTPSQALVFLLGGGQFGIDILQIQEIRGNDRATPIPSSPPFFKGVTNLRGQYVPVIDLRIKLGIAVPEAREDGVTIILHTGSQDVGVVVDSVSEVMAVEPAALKPAPFARYAASAAYIRGLIEHADATVVLLDVERLLDANELELAGLMAAAQADAVASA